MISQPIKKKNPANNETMTIPATQMNQDPTRSRYHPGFFCAVPGSRKVMLEGAWSLSAWIWD
jgi:hypothetical protein